MDLNLLGQLAGVSSPICTLAALELRRLALEAPREPLCRVLELSGSPQHDSQPEPSLWSGVKALLVFALCIHQGFLSITVAFFGADPDGPSVPLFSQAFYADCRDRLSERGILVTQSGVTFMQEHEARDTHARMSPLFADATLYLTQVPTYGAGYMTLGWGCGSVEPRRTPLAEIERRFAAAAIETRYYGPAVHVASFALPGYIEALKR